MTLIRIILPTSHPLVRDVTTVAWRLLLYLTFMTAAFPQKTDPAVRCSAPASITASHGALGDVSRAVSIVIK